VVRYRGRRDCREQEQQPAARLVATRAVDEQRSLAAAIGNHAFSALVARSVKQPATTTARWSAPLGLGVASNAFEASTVLAGIRAEAGVLVQAGFERLDEFATDAEIWQDQLGWLARALTPDEVEGLVGLSEEFESAYTAAMTDLAATLARQVERWTVAPMSDDDLVPLREVVHRRFVDSEDETIEAASDLVGEAEKLVSEVKRWVSDAAKLEKAFRQTKRLAGLEKQVKQISGGLGKVKKIVDLANNVGTLTGALGETPGGVDDIAVTEAALGVLDFTISNAGVPGLTQLWDEYICKAAKLCLDRLGDIEEQLSTNDRRGGGAGAATDLRLFWEQRRHEDGAFDIEDAAVRDPERDFPGGQAMLCFMWFLMRHPEYNWRVIPWEVEDYFVEHRELFNAGARGDLWEPQSTFDPWDHESSGNLEDWVRENRDQVWVKLYGAMPKPS
jgi:hypothetical protein